ncbi:MAG TPA: protein kinase [Polyangiaceae bacterium]|nr:protein kinase [Polyangiaceae bacterium]
MTLAPGSMVNPSVRLIRPLGEGAMGSVWIADHLGLKTEVAVKFIHSHLAAEHPELLKRFEQEASVAARIRSPHVVQTFDHGLMGERRPYIVMELLEGESLDAMLARCGPLPAPTIAQVLVQVSRALGKAHKLGIVHRDIKPDNIFVIHGEDGIFCKVLDFGIAKETHLPKMGGLTNADVLIGTPEYMSPEQVMTGREVDFRADLWALAVTAYQLLTGRLPFTGQAIGSLVVKLLNCRYVPPSQLRPGLMPSVDAWFARALHRDPTQRFPSAREMARDFVHLVAGQPSLLDELSLEDISAPQQALPRAAPAAPGTLSGSSSNLTTPSRLQRRRMASIVAAAVGVSVLSIVAVVALVAALRDATPAVKEPAPPEPASEAPAQPSETDEPEEKPMTKPTATPTAAESAAPTAKPAQQRRTAPPPPPPVTKSGRKDHGF